MVKTTQTVLEELHSYASPKAKITRMLRSGELTQVKRGLFVQGNLESHLALAMWLSGPSYLSFQYALAYYGLIPERVVLYTCAGYNQNKDKLYETPFGTFQYQYLPKHVYPYCITRKEDNGQPFIIATPEKALCDMVYKTSGITKVASIPSLLFEDWRMEEDTVRSLDNQSIQFLAPLYRRKSVLALAKWFANSMLNHQS